MSFHIWQLSTLRIRLINALSMIGLLHVTTGCNEASTNSPDTVLVNAQSAELGSSVSAKSLRNILSSIRLMRWNGAPSAVGTVSRSGTVDCDSIGDLTLVRHVMGKTHVRVVRCRPVATLDVVVPSEVLLGDSTQVLLLDARSTHGVPIDRLAAIVRIADTSIVRLRGDTIVPVRSGLTRVDVDLANCKVSRLVRIKGVAATLESIAVWEVFRRPLDLVSGEIASFRIPRGDFRIRLALDSSAVSSFRLAVTHSQCGATPGMRHDYYCRTDTNSFVAVRRLDRARKTSDSVTLEVERHDPELMRSLTRNVSPDGVGSRCVAEEKTS